jgi:hypothetical protein
MRTTVTIADDLLDSAKHLAVQRGTSVGSVLEDALRLLLSRTGEGTTRRVELPVFRGRPGLQPGVDLNDNQALRDLMDEDA